LHFFYRRIVCRQEGDREVSRAEGAAFARKHGCLFVETSAKVNVAVGQAFEELVMKVLDTPSLLNASNTSRLNVGAANGRSSSTCCS
jgi:Ras-related protein Rab-18